jgi:low affinity Fe/Cu permease
MKIDINVIIMVFVIMLFIGLVILGVLVRNYHSAVNGKMDKLLKTTEELGKAIGIAQEKKEQKEREEKL